MTTTLADSVALHQADALHWLRGMPDNSLELVIGSPPYALKGQRYIGKRTKWSVDAWVDWMTAVTVEATRCAKRQVIWIVNGPVRGGEYHPVVEMLISACYRLEGVHCERPVIWHKNAPPSRKDWLGNDWEFCASFFGDEAERVFNWEAIADAPRYTSGGDFRQRTDNGERRKGSSYPKGKLARPRDVWRVTVGGGHLGHDLAHENEAPFPLKLIERFILLCTMESDLVCDPFIGSGTTAHACVLHGRKCVGLDHRRSQISLTERRLKTIEV